jgi:epoxide hydrolase
VQELAEYWRSGYEWRVHERTMNSFAQFTTVIDEQNVHFLHVRSAEPDALPLIMTHGWPGSIVRIERLRTFRSTGSGYGALQSTRPQTLAYGLTDSPAGQLAWIAEKFGEWTDGGLAAVDRGQLLTNITLYWLTRTAGSSARLYYEARAGGGGPPAPSTMPTGVAVFPQEIAAPVRRLAEMSNYIVHWTEFDRGGHFAAMEQPDLLVGDVRAFFRPFRT